MAREMLVRRLGSFTYCSAPANPPCQAPASVANSDAEFSTTINKEKIYTLILVQCYEKFRAALEKKKETLQARRASSHVGRRIRKYSQRQAIAQLHSELKA